MRSLSRSFITPIPRRIELTAANVLASRPQDVIIFIVGGTTYEEAKTVAQLNAQFAAGHGLAGSIGPAGPVSANTRIILGGTCVHNSKRCAGERRMGVQSRVLTGSLVAFSLLPRTAS